MLNVLKYCISDCGSTPCTPTTYCISDSIIYLVTKDGIGGSAKFGKSGTPSGNYFFSNDHYLMTTSTSGSGTLGSIYVCDNSGCSAVTDTTNITYFNSKSSDLTCAYNSGDVCGAGITNKSYYDTTSKKIINCSTNKCNLSSVTGYYIDYGSSNTINYLITCSNSSCITEKHTGTAVEFYINSGLDKSTQPIIYYNGAAFSSIIGNPIGVYLDSSTLSGARYSNIIICSSTTKCLSTANDSAIFLNSANILDSAKSPAPLIKCISSGCTEVLFTTAITGDNSNNAYYIDGITKNLIQCVITPSPLSVSCDIYNKNTSNKYYLDYSTSSSSTSCVSSVFGATSSTGFCSLNIISCDSSSLCKSSAIYTESQFLDGDSSTNLIVCNTFGDDFFCTTIPAINLTYYYINSGNFDGEHPLLYCGDSSTTTCVEKKASTNGYYMSDNGIFITSDPYNIETIGHLIHCSNSKTCIKSLDLANKGYYVNAGVNITNKPLILFDPETSTIYETSPTSKDSIYLDSSSFITSSYTNLIYCSSINNCTTFKSKDGYYYNSGYIDEDSDVIIECDKTGCEIDPNIQTCTSDESVSLKPGNYCFRKEVGSGKDLNFVVNEFIINSENIDTTNQNITYTNGSNINYRYVRVSNGNFPGITNEVSTLFEIKSNSITRVNTDGIFIINSKNEKVDTINGFINLGSSFTTIYTCSTSTQLCSLSSSCKDGTYLYDEGNHRGYQCADDFISPINEAGYYIDSSYIVDKNFTPAIMKCTDNGNCERYIPKNSYFLNAGSDKAYHPLIYCSDNNCTTKEVSMGYYRAEFGHSGVIYCSSNSFCGISPLRYNYYINSGVDKNIKPIIVCNDGINCNTKQAYLGYYLVKEYSNLLIDCDNTSLCQLKTATIGYYYNSANNYNSDNGETIIKCYISTYGSNTICNTEKRNKGFYLSGSSNNILINCIGNKCQSITVNNGIFRAATNSKTSEKGVSSKSRDQYNDEDGNTIEKEIINDEEGEEERDDLLEYIYHIGRIAEEENEKDIDDSNNDDNIYEYYSENENSNDILMEINNNNSMIDDINEENNNDSDNDFDYNYDDNLDNPDINSVNLKRDMEDMNKNLELSNRATSNEASYTLIICNDGSCNELTSEELNLIPICTYNNDVCYLDNSRISTIQNVRITSVVAGEYCTDASRSTIYFATETIVEYNNVISGVLSTSKSSTKNCIKASAQYSNNLFTVGNNIYRVNEGYITQVFDTGYYFIDIIKNSLVYGMEIKDYNDINVLLYKCDGASCRIMDKPSSTTYYTDVSKRIIKYSLEDDKYLFVNDKQENICTFSYNTCTPKYDIMENDFCITAEGNLVVARETIKAKETGQCFSSNSINKNVLAYSHSSTLYLLNSNAAKQVTMSGYFFAENVNYYSADYRSFNTTRAGITLYGCIENNCKIYEPKPNIYYFDVLTNYLIEKTKDNIWISPYSLGYINVSVNPEETYIYSYTISENKELLLTKVNKDGYYYTIDQKMYQCDTQSTKSCKEIEDTAYILTNTNELYYCIVDSEGEDTECFKKTCALGQTYYIQDNYYKCTIGSYFELIRQKTCDYNEVLVINFPLIYIDSFPTSIYKTISNIAKNNQYLPTEKESRTSLESVQGVFTNCTIDDYDSSIINYDQICMANHVKLNQDKEPDICSIQLLGYTFCVVDDGDNPNKCNPSSAFTQKNISLWNIINRKNNNN
ncbi:hypothetical protein BCR32DRAFT_303912 [Anaeromyces robustus]|uniref:Scaffoldin n=1 Tax=Anaeromyces robustus TaxID=1754192 RepID=A0A1Y1XJ67_9FUNG|nr:hypothetical protein BCR32DRAFT_303912 [Anaeromyces robustus]|eukprot:ORX85797.1 hypothetical protein BCR32DRAFT_303912 [Anaeromyces robustus]